MVGVPWIGGENDKEHLVIIIIIMIMIITNIIS